MKKTLVLASLLAAFGAASAQSTVTLGGTIAGSYGSVADTVAGAPINNNTAGSRYAERGFRMNDVTVRMSGTENLGAGLTASFATAFENSSSARGNAFNRIDTALTLNGGFGSLSISNTRGSDLLATIGMVGGVSLTNGIYDMGATAGSFLGTSSNILTRSAIDHVQFTSKPMGGVSFGFGHSELASDGSGVASMKNNTLSATYAAGPLVAGFAYKAASGAPLVSGVRKTNMELAANYDLGVAKIGFGIDTKRAATASASTTEKMAIGFGVSVPMGASTLGLNYAKRGTSKLMEASYNYALSPRTSTQFAMGTQNGSGDAKRTQARLRLVHNF